MAELMVTLVTEGTSAAEVASRIAIDADGEYISEWKSIEVVRLSD